MSKLNKRTTIVLNVFQLPILIALLLVAGVSAGALKLEKGAKAGNRINQAVLAEEDEKDSEDSKDEEDKSDEEDKNDESDSNNDTGDRNDNEDADKVENDNETDNEDVNEVEDKNDEDANKEDVELDEEAVLISTVTNPDGTVTKTYQITEDGKVETKTVTYNVFGKVIKEDEENEDGTKHDETIELVSTVDNGDGTITKTFKITDEDGKVKMKAITYDKDGKVIKIVELNPDGTVKEEKDIEEDDRDEDGNEVEFKYENSTNSIPALSNLIEAQLEQEIETNSKLGTTVDKVELELKTINGKYEYEGATFKDGKLFGLFDVTIPMGIEIDPATGRIISVTQTFWSKLLDFLSL